MYRKITKKVVAVMLMAAMSIGLIACGQSKGLDSIKKVEESSEISTADESVMAEEASISFGKFEAVDLDGNKVTEAVFEKKELTVVNIWGTFCGPCIREMPELGEWDRELNEKVQIIGLVEDISGIDDKEHIELAKEITSKANADFMQLIGGDGQFAKITSSLIGVPTTIFVDKSGNIVGEPILGADVDGYKAFVKEYFNE